MDNMLNESKYTLMVKNIRKLAEDLLGMSSQLVGAVGGNELDQMVSGALDASANLIAFSKYFLDDGTVSMESVAGNYNKVLSAVRKLAVESKAVQGSDADIFVDPYESEYLPKEMLSDESLQGVTESVMEVNDILPDDLDDDPDAVFNTNPDGTPTEFDIATPLEHDPFVVQVFRNNSELIDPPEQFSPDVDAVVPVEAPEGDVSEVPVDAVVDAVIDVVADASVKEPQVEVKESKELPKSRVDPKSTENVLPPQFKDVAEVKAANDRIAEDTSGNLRLLAMLAGDASW